MLDIEILNKKYGQKVVLNNIKLSLKTNGIYGIIGKNGQGKTTFFKCLKDLTPYDVGQSIIKTNQLYKTK